ncbi:Uncharacterised protein [uncultured archaeon]|nr:Uncharacterised protein [uncultured archaeon]
MRTQTFVLMIASVAALLLISIAIQPKKDLIDPWHGASYGQTAYSARDDASHPSDDPDHFEWWYFDAQFEECSVAVAMHATNVSNPGSRRPHIEANLFCPNGTTRIVKEYDPASFSASNETCDVSIAGNRAQGNLSDYHLTVDEGGLGMDLWFDSTVPSWRPGTGAIRFGDGTDQFSWFVAVPRASVNGTLTINGTRFNVSGIGYHDHNWGNVPLFTEISEWYWGRVYSGNLTLIYADISLDGKYDQTVVSPMMVAVGDRIVSDGSGFSLLPSGFIPDSATGNRRPSRISLVLNESHATGRIDMDVLNVTDGRDLTEGRSGIERSVIHLLVGHPTYYRFLSYAAGNLVIDGTKYSIGEDVISEQIKMR